MTYFCARKYEFYGKKQRAQYQKAQRQIAQGAGQNQASRNSSQRKIESHCKEIQY